MEYFLIAHALALSPVAQSTPAADACQEYEFVRDYFELVQAVQDAQHTMDRVTDPFSRDRETVPWDLQLAGMQVENAQNLVEVLEAQPTCHSYMHAGKPFGQHWIDLADKTDDLAKRLKDMRHTLGY